MKEKIGKWCSQGLWTIDMVKTAVVKGLISKEDYKEITGEDYTA